MTSSSETPNSERRRAFASERAAFARLSVPRLIELLASERLRTRFLAEMCLRDATGT